MQINCSHQKKNPEGISQVALCLLLYSYNCVEKQPLTPICNLGKRLSIWLKSEIVIGILVALMSSPLSLMLFYITPFYWGCFCFKQYFLLISILFPLLPSYYSGHSLPPAALSKRLLLFLPQRLLALSFPCV